MLKITTLERRNQRILLVEGKLEGPWVTELRTAWNEARIAHPGRIVIDLKDAVVTSELGQNLLREMKSEGAQFACDGVFNRHVLRRLARDCVKVADR
jgi:hypothetical protein